ncbi:MAG: hypothetical protein WA057_05370 [Candidatus Magasanikiibacteriota bacterium]
MIKKEFITKYNFSKDTSKAGRILECVKVGQIYISRVVMEPGVITGNYYHKETNSMYMVEAGKVKFKFVQVNTKETKEMELKVGSSLVNLPPFVAIASKNCGTEKACVVVFSDRPLRSGDDFPFEILKK